MGRVLAAVAAVMFVMVIAGCGSSSRATPQPSDAPTESAETSIGAAIAPDDPALPHDDVAGRTPDDVVIELVAARNAENWEAAYALYAAPEVDLETAAREWRAADEHLRDFTVLETRVTELDTAFVRVTYSADTSVPIAVREPGEWWIVYRVDGVWRVKWMPRQ